MDQERFVRAQADYQARKQELDSGRISRQQFNSSLGLLIIRDTDGRAWRLDSQGHWQVEDGMAWAQADPFDGREESSPSLPSSMTSTCRSMFFNGTVLLIIVFLCVLDAAGLALASNRGLIDLNALSAAAPTTALSGSFAVQAPAATPTIITAATPATPAGTILSPTAQPAATATKVSSPTLSASPTISPTEPQGIYVIGLRSDPALPRRGQPVIFYVTFLNTMDGASVSRWSVYVFTPGQPNHAFGQTPGKANEIQTGTNELRAASDWALRGRGACENFVVRVGLINASGQVSLFLMPDGQVFGQDLTVC